MYIEITLNAMQAQIKRLDEKLDYLIDKLVPTPEPNNSKEESPEQFSSKMSGDEPRYCKCGNKLNSNKDLGKCKKCLKEQLKH